MLGKTLASGTLALLLFTAACGEDGIRPESPSLSAAEADLLASEFDAMVGSVLGGAFGPFFSAAPTGGAALAAVPVPVSQTFSRTVSCPKGGTTTIAGSITGSADRETQTIATETSATKTQAACAHATRDGTVITVTGNPNLAIKSTRKVVKGMPSGPQTTTQKGGFTYSTSTGKSGSCAVDITSTFNPDAKTHTVKGTMCGRTIDRTRSR